MKRILSILTAITMMCCLLTTGVLAADSPAHKHVFGEKTLLTPATCQTQGVIISYCTGEGECELPNRMWSEPLPIVDCSPVEERFGVREETCEQDGYTGDVRCKWCLTVLEEGEVIPKTGHTPGDWVTDAWKSDETVTVQYSYCTVCKELVETREVPNEDGKLPEAPQVHEHAFDETVIEIEPTCQTEGLAVKHCTAEGYCDYIGRTVSEVLPKTECSPADNRIGQVDATCASEGNTGDAICRWCLTVIEEGEVIPALDHSPADKRIGAIAATCLLEGRSGTLLCKECLAVIEESEVLPKAEHTPGEWIKDELRSDDNVTVQYRFCTACKLLVDTQEVPVDRGEPDIIDNPFVDLYKDAYYYDAVLWAVGHNITSGTSDVTFSPNMSCTRGQVVTFLWRSAGSPEPNLVFNPFTDVSETDYYYKAVLWAVEQGITSGTSLTTFSPDQPCTRAQVVTFLWRSEGSPEADASLELFIDVSKNDYYHKAVIWAAQNDITGGTSFFIFSPDNVCTRAQIVTFLYKASQI